jgi:hypothetical protein
MKRLDYWLQTDSRTQIPVPDCGWEIWRIRAYPERITSAYLRAAVAVHVPADRIFRDL